MSLQLPRGKRKFDLLDASGETLRFGPVSRLHSRSQLRFQVEQASMWFFALVLLGIFIGVPTSLPIKALAFVGAMMMVPLALTARRRALGSLNAGNCIVIDLREGKVDFGNKQGLSGVFDCGELILWVHPASITSPGAGAADRSDISSTDWWLTLVHESGSFGRTRTATVPLYGPGGLADMELAARRLHDVAGWRELLVERIR